MPSKRIEMANVPLPGNNQDQYGTIISACRATCASLAIHHACYHLLHRHPLGVANLVSKAEETGEKMQNVFPRVLVACIAEGRPAREAEFNDLAETILQQAFQSRPVEAARKLAVIVADFAFHGRHTVS